MIEVTIRCKNAVEACIAKVGGVTELAGRLGVNRETIRRWRHAGRFPDDVRLKQAAQAAGLSLKSLRAREVA